MARLSVEKIHQSGSVRMVSTTHHKISPTPSRGAKNLQGQLVADHESECSHYNHPDPGEGPVSETKLEVEGFAESQNSKSEDQEDEETAAENESISGDECVFEGVSQSMCSPPDRILIDQD